MAIVLSKHDIIVVPTKTVNDKNLSVEARFLLIVLFSLQDKHVDYNKLALITGHTVKTIRKYMKELEINKYIVETEDGYDVFFEKA